MTERPNLTGRLFTLLVVELTGGERKKAQHLLMKIGTIWSLMDQCMIVTEATEEETFEVFSALACTEDELIAIIEER